MYIFYIIIAVFMIRSDTKGGTTRRFNYCKMMLTTTLQSLLTFVVLGQPLIQHVCSNECGVDTMCEGHSAVQMKKSTALFLLSVPADKFSTDVRKTFCSVSILLNSLPLSNKGWNGTSVSSLYSNIIP